MDRPAAPSRVDTALLMIRVILGIIFIYHGSQKLFGWFAGGGLHGTAGYFKSLGIPLPFVSAVLCGLAEFVGGIFLLIGNGLRVALVPLLINMVVATWVNAHNGFNVLNNGAEFPLELLITLAALELTGPGRYTLLPGSYGERAGSGSRLHPPIGMPTIAKQH